MSSAIGLGNDNDTPTDTQNTAWSDPLGLYGGNTPKVTGTVTIEPAQTKQAPAGGFLDHLDATDRRDLINTVLAEAGGEGDDGMAAVASVIKNRAARRGKGAGDIVREPKQFSGYEAPGADVRKLFDDPAAVERASKIINGVFDGEIADSTGGADHYHADSVSPSWARTMPETARIGGHTFYASSEGAASRRARAEEPFKALMKNNGDPTADKADQDQDAPDGGKFLLTKLQAGHPDTYVSLMQPAFRSGLTAMFEDAPDYVKAGLDLESGARSPKRQAEIISENAGKYGFNPSKWEADVAELGPEAAGAKWRPFFKSIGLTRNIGMPGGSKHQHGEAADLGWKGGAYANAPANVKAWVKANAGNYGMNFPMDHEPWHIEINGARDGKGSASASAAPRRPVSTIDADSSFKVSDPLGLYGNGANPIGDAVTSSLQMKSDQADAETAQAKSDAQDAAIARNNLTAEQTLASDPKRYEMVDADQAEKWQEDWNAKNKSSGRVGDFVRNVGIGAAQTSSSISNLNRLLISKLPGGDTINNTLDGIERWMGSWTGNNKTVEEIRQEGIQRQENTLTDRTQEALQKKAWDDGKLGDALTDPDWYLANIARSLPAMAASMAPTAALARGAFTVALERGATQVAAAARAASTATIAGGVSEGLLGGADAASQVKDQISKMPREQLLQTDAVKSMMAEGMSGDEAIKAVSDSVQTQAMIYAGVATGAFGGMGDRALAKIIGEGVSGSLARRVASGTARGMVAEGALEELPQSVGQQVAQNAAMRGVNPDQDLTEGVGEAAVSGLAIGGAMGGAMGGAGGAMSPRSHDAHANPDQPTAADMPATEPTPAPAAPGAAAPSPDGMQPARKGVLSQAIQHAQDQAAARGAGPIGRPAIGETVTVAPDGLPPFMAVVDSFDGDEVVVIDHGSGEYLQVPATDISRSAAEPAASAPAASSVLPEVSNDPALEPAAPIAGEIRTEVAPAKQDVAATARFPGAPGAGSRVMVDDATLGRFPARVESYENNGTEVLITNDQGDSYQVPLDSVKVNGQTPKQVEAEELKRNPPIEREIGDAGPLSRKVGKGTVVLPDEKHAELYDFARERFMSQRLSGASRLDMNDAMLPRQKALAKQFGVSVEAAGSMADDYRYRVEKAGNDARSALPVQMHPVNASRLKGWQAEQQKAEGNAPADGGDDAHWWDVTLTASGRREILEAANVKRPDKSMWQHLTPAIRKKLAMFRVDGPLPSATPEQTFTTAKGSTYTVHADGTTTRNKAERSDPGHEGDKGIKPRTERTVYVSTNAGALSAAGLQGLGPKGARVAIKDGRATLVTWNEKEGGWGASEGSRGIEISDKPSVGAYPLELWNKAKDVPGYEAYSRMHAGNQITELSDTQPAKADATSEKADTESQNADTSTAAIELTPDDAAEFGSLLLDVSPDDDGKYRLALTADEQNKLKRAGYAVEGVPSATMVAYESAQDILERGEQAAKATRAAKKTDAAANEAATSPTNDLPEPTQAQKDAGNYKVGRVSLGGMDISIENPAGSERKGVDAGGKPWSVEMKSHYGYIRGTIGRDKDHIDVFVKPGTEELTDASPVFVVDQNSGKGAFDEHKVMLGFDSLDEARAAYLENYTADWNGLGAITPATLGDFKDWAKNADTSKRFAVEKPAEPAEAAPVKWFGTRQKAQAHINKNRLGGSHEIREANRRFEIHPKAEKTDSQAPAPKAETGKITAAEVREVFRSKEFKAAYADIAATQMGTPHPESAVAFELAQGWLDAKAGKRPKQQAVSSHSPNGGFDPIAPYYMGYVAARDGKARVIRSSEQEATYAELTSPAPKPAMADAPVAAPASEKPAAQPAKPKKGKGPSLVDRAENYFRPGRDIPGYGGTDRVISFNRGEGGLWNVTVAEVKAGGKLDRERTHNTMPSERELAAWERQNPVQPAAAQKAPPVAEPAPAKPAPAVSENKIFTADAAEKARDLLRRKLNQLNSGLDPEIVQAGITLAGYHVEKGARTFAAYASAMLNDLGEVARPYLKSWYMGVKYHPHAASFEGMSTAAEVEAADVATIQTEPSNEPSELDRERAGSLEGIPADEVRQPEEGRNARNGAEGRGRADVSTGGRAGEERVSAGRGVSDGEGGVSVPAGGRQRNGQQSLDLAPALERSEAGPQERAEPVDPEAFAKAPDGSTRFGQIDDVTAAAIGRQAGEIRLRQGTDAWGLQHIKARHEEQIRQVGFPTVEAFVAKIARDFTAIYRRDGRSLDVVLDNGPHGKLIVQLEPSTEGDFYDVKTATPTRSDQFKNKKPLWEQAGPSKSSAETNSLNPKDQSPRNISDPLANVQSAATPAQNRPADHIIAVGDGIGDGGAKAKFRGNLSAIQILRKLDEEKRPATRQEQAELAKWVGWGGLRSAFYREDGSVTKGWEREARDLKALLTPAEYSAAESSTRNAHYTSPEIVDGIWKAVSRLGFKGGQVLEPSVGAGNFLGLMPGSVREQSHVTGVELDHITGGIAKNLYPTANIQAPLGFEKLSVPDDYFDLAIGNPPFGSERLYDKDRRGLNKFSIHNFFFAKSIDTLRPGGVLAMVVTNRFLDGNNEAARNYIASRADLIGAIRLPNNAFLKNAGTEVTTDIVFLRKREEGEPQGSTAWTNVADYRGKDGKTVPLNRYFIDNPDMMLGDFGAHGTMYGPDEPALIAREGADTAKELAAAINKLPQDLIKRPGAPVVIEPVTVAEGVRDVQVGSMFAAPDGSVHTRLPDRIGEARSEPVTFASDTAKERVSGMVRIRDAFARLRRAQIDERATDAQVENLRKRLNTVYDAFTAKHGPINQDVNKRLFRDDPTWPQISALEQSFDKGISSTVAKKTGEKAKAASAAKAAIFSKRTQQPYKVPTAASSARDALALSLNATGAIDLDLMSRLYSKSPAAIVDELGPLVYKTPAGAYEPSDQYLSGNVKAKLAQAEEAAKVDPDYRRNVAALRDVIPADIEAVDIDVKPGAPWLPANHVVDFIDHITDAKGANAFYSPANAKWDLDIPNPAAAAQTLWATDRVRLGAVVSAALNGQTVTVYDKTRDGQEVNQAATEAANEKVERVKAEWGRWIWTDDARRDELARLYNDTFNTDVVRVFDGSHLTLPGKVGDDVISLRPHQKAFVWRTLQSGTTLADHTVGAGKTFAAITSAMEKRRIGQAKKPMFAVPNHLVGQWAADFIRLYPGAKVLAATKKDFEAENRKRLFARIATGDWDAVIVAHSSFGRIGMNPEYEARFIQDQLDDLETSISELRRNTGEKSRNISQLTKWRDNMKAKLQRLLDAGRKDDGLTFDELGVDALYVDEAHEFKNLAFSTSMTRVAGLGNPLGSQKAADLFMKSRYILERTGGKNLTFLTGTPISNTMAEMYTVQRYLDNDTMKAMGISHFDAWARVFGEVVTDWELSPSGQYKLNSRFARFVNLPELMQRYLSFADVITNDDIKRQLAAIGKKLPLPNVKGGSPAIVVVERSPDQAQYIGIPKVTENGEEYPQGSLVYRAEHLPKKAEKGADNMLKVMSDARKAALDMRLINPSYGDYHNSKIHHAADDMVRLYKAWDEKKGTQLVFIDLSTPKKAKAAEEKRIRDLMAKAEQGDEAAQETLDNMSPDEFMALESPFSVYDDLKDKLIERGIPEPEIAFIHDANTDAQKEELFGKVRSGRVRFLFGSTAKMGAGTNVQNRLVALHHMDAPWRPSDLEQRDGRGIRQGNELYNEDPDNFEIEIRRYATKNTLDARQWQTIEVKAKFIQQLRKGNLKDRTIEDISGEAANAAEMKAAASGNPLILEEMEARRKLKTLQNRATEHDREQHRIKSRIRNMGEESATIDARAGDLAKDAKAAEELDGKAFAAEFDGTTFDKPKEFGAAMVAAMRKAALDKSDVEATGRYGSFEISIRHQYDRAFIVSVKGAGDHEVWVNDAADQDATGLSQRVTNTVRKLRDAPQADAERKAEIARQLPGMESQIGEWPHAQDLADTAAQHRSLVDRLKPQPKAQAAQVAVTSDDPAGDIDPPVEKQPDDALTTRHGGLRSMAAPQRPAGKSIRDFATDHIRAIGRQTGNEHIMLFDDDGSMVEYGTAGVSNNTGMNNRLYSAIMNPTRRLVVYHNHPSNSHLSSSDVSFLGYPGLYSVWSLGHAGNDTRAALTPDAKTRVQAMGPNRAVRDLADAMTYASRVIRQQHQQMLNDGRLSEETANSFHFYFALRMLERANILDIQTTQPYDTGRIEGLDALIDEHAGNLAKAFYDDKQASIRRNDRQPEPLRHIAEVARASDGPQQSASGRPAAGGFAEGSSRSDPREGGLGESRERVSARSDDNRPVKATQERVITELRGKLTDLTPALLKAIPLNYFVELAQKNMTAVADYMRVKRAMDAFRGNQHAAADEIAQEWLKYTRLGFVGKDLARAEELADLMHASTLSGIDPTEDTKENRGVPAYESLKRRFDKLPPKGKELYVKVRDAYAKQALQLDEILLDNVRKAQQIALDRADKRYRKTLEQIRDVGLTGLDKKKAEEDAASAHKAETTKAKYAGKARLTKLRIAFESSRVQGPYFPLARFGRYFVTVRDVDGRVLSFSKYEKAADRDRAARGLANEFPAGKIEKGVMEKTDDVRRAMDPRMVAEIEEILGGANVGGDVMDQIWQRYLESMPDLSTRKRQIHRKGTAGFQGDALRSFSSHMFHASHQMARVKYGMELQELVNVAMDQAKEADDTTKAVTLANELSSRHDWVMNPTGSKLAQTMTSAAFVWYLASSPASAMVNVTQTVMMGAPILGARFGGITKATAAIGKASADSISGKGSVANANLTEDEKKAMDAFYQSGLIDRTQSHDIAGVGETGVNYSPLRARVMGVISWAFHRAEVWNREVTALAAYRLARDNGANWTEAVDQAHDLTWKTHFDYSNSSRPALLQNDFAKVALVFRQYNINMLYRVGRDIQQSMKGDTPQARREARYQLAGIVGMMSLMAGVTGTIGFNLIMSALGMAFGDDDDPLEYDERFKQNVVEILGPELGGILLNGAPGHYLGIDLSSRIGMPDLWFRSPTKELQGKEEFQYWLAQGLGASVAMGESLWNGFSVMKDEGNVARGLEMMAPKAIRDLMKAYRYNDEGLTTIRGDEIMSPKEMGVHEILAQAMGFTPASVSERWDRNSALKNAERSIKDKRQRLINRYAMAAMSGDKDDMAEAIEGMKKFNAVPAHAGVEITKKSLQSSIKTRARNAAKRQDGVLIQNKELNRSLRDTLAPSVYGVNDDEEDD